MEGPLLGDALSAVRVAWLDGKLPSRDAALTFATEWTRRAKRRQERAQKTHATNRRR